VSAIDRIRTLWRYRELLHLLLMQDLKLRYRRSALGFLWSLLNPLLTMLTLALVFRFLVRLEMANYALFLLSSLLPWGFFAVTLSAAPACLLQQEELIRRQPLPKLVFPLSLAASNLVNLVLSYAVLLTLLAPFLGFRPSWSLLCLPLGLLCLVAFTVGLSALLAVANVYLRDLQHIVGVVLPAWLYASPILYPLEIPGQPPLVPEEYHLLFKLNPLYSLLQLFVRPIYWQTMPPLQDLVLAVGTSLAVLAFGLMIFWRKEDDLVFHL